MSDYNLDDQVPEHFEFVLSGHKYKFRYPTTEEISAAQKIEDGSQEQLEWIYTFVTGDEASPPIKEVLDKVNTKKLQRFNQMLKAEFSVE